MNLNVIGGALGIAVLAAIFVYGQHEPAKTEPVPAVVIKPAPAPAPAPVTKAPAPVVKQTLPSKAPLPAPAPDKNVIYHRVEHGGAQGAEVPCKAVKLFAEGKSPAELAAFAKQYGVTVESLARYYVCD